VTTNSTEKKILFKRLNVCCFDCWHCHYQ